MRQRVVTLFNPFMFLTRQRLRVRLNAQIPPVASAAGREAAFGRPLLFLYT
jgi:hypothetical protein